MDASEPTIPPVAGTGLPIEAARDEVGDAVRSGSLVLVAEPGAGKSTVVPAWLAGLVPGRVVVLEPRRLAARATAARLAERWGEDVGGLVGLTMRGERRVSDRTRIEVVTEAVLTRRLQQDPALDGVGAVVFDEFHERSVHADLGLALSLDVRAALRPDLVVVVMSATLDPAPVAAVLGGAPVVTVAGRTHPVATVHLDRPRPERWAAAVADAARTALAETTGDVLVFVPGRAEIDDVRRRLGSPAGVEVAALHGGVAAGDQRRLLAATRSGVRRVVVATSVAETSVTLPGITAVVDGGRLRQPRFDERTGLGRLETVAVTRFAADQRRGRAGRTGPGRCYRLWSLEDHRHLDAASPPEVTAGDPLPLALELARWGDADGRGLAWVDRPPAERLATARRALALLGLADDRGRLTDRGRRAATLPLHPRLSALVLHGSERGAGRLAATAAAALDRGSAERRGDLRTVVEHAADDAALRREAVRLARRAGVDGDGSLDADALAPLLATAWPDRIAQQRAGDRQRYLLAGGGEVRLPPASPLSAAELLVVADAGGVQAPPTVGVAVPIERPEVLRAAAAHLTWEDEVTWDDRAGGVVARRRQRLGALVLHSEPHPEPPLAAVAAAVADGVRRRGVGVLGWTDAGRRLQSRVAFCRHHGAELPALDDDALGDRLDEWLLPVLPALPDVTAPGGVGRLDPLPLLVDQLTWQQRRLVDRLAPAELAPPRGRARPIRYDDGEARWAVRIQDLFGMDRHPAVVDGAVPLVVELLSPAGRPAQVTTDLPGFWRGSYRQVRAELRGRYPKHPWPEEPWRDPTS